MPGCSQVSHRCWGSLNPPQNSGLESRSSCLSLQSRCLGPAVLLGAQHKRDAEHGLPCATGAVVAIARLSNSRRAPAGAGWKQRPRWGLPALTFH